MKTFCKFWVGAIASLSFTGLGWCQTGQITNLSDEGAKVYPWRGTGSEVQQSNATPTPPNIKGPGETVRFFQASGQAHQQGQDVPNPPANAAPGAGEQQVPLTVQSNAISENGCYNQNRCDRCQIGDPQRLFGSTPNGFMIGGFTQFGYHNFTSANFNHEPGEFRSHQNWFYVGREARPTCGWDKGFRVDAVYGIDGQEIQAFGNSPTGNPSDWDNSWDHGSYGWALPQAYVQLANCDWDVRIGKFLSPIGYESIPSIDNFFYSRTYLRTLTEPYSHTGILGERKIDNGLSVLVGLTLGWDTGFDRNSDGMNLLTGMRYQLNQNVRVGMTSAWGDSGYRGSGILSSAFAEVQLTDRVCYVLQGDFVNLQNNDEFGLVNGLYYHANRCFALGSRLEWWKSDRFLNTSQSTYSWAIGGNYRPHSNIVIRPELRNDWGVFAVDAGQTIFGIDAIVCF